MTTPETLRIRTRRHFFADCGIGLGQVALAGLLARDARAGSVPTAPKEPQTTPRAKRVIYLFQAGAPSQLELFDYKPQLAEMEGKPLPKSIVGDQRYAFIQPDAGVLGPQFSFAQHGESGAWLSDRLPHLAGVVDDIAFAKAVHTDHFNHSPAQIFMNTGHGIPGRPALGSWLSYGIGSLADDLPSFVVLNSGGNLSGGAAMWSHGFLPGTHQGVPFRSAGDPILHVSNPDGYDDRAQRDSLDLIAALNRKRQAVVRDPEVETRINAYEMAFRMQSRAPELMDLSSETEETKNLYGMTDPDRTGGYARNCLLARRLVERGVRFVQVYHSGWDHHSNVAGGVRGKAAQVDQASAALLIDLKRRGLLDDTLVVWGGEFGRTPMVEASAALGRSQGRDHHPQAFTVWMAGGGAKPGVSHGGTDELGFHVTEGGVHVHDLQATILHLLGIDHERLTYNVNGLEFRLTGVEEHHPVKELIA